MKFKGIIQASNIAIMEINHEEKMFTIEGIEALAKSTEDADSLKELNLAYKALKGQNVIELNQQELL